MARGRKPTEEKVVPLTEDGGQSHNLDERARARLAELRPEGLTGELLWTFDRLALPLCHPTVARLKPHHMLMFVQLCRVIVRHERLTLLLEDGETYTNKGGRGGNQQKSRPEVSQLNETFRQIRALASDFGMTPASERGLQGGGQMGFDFPDPNSPEAYLS